MFARAVELARSIEAQEIAPSLFVLALLENEALEERQVFQETGLNLDRLRELVCVEPRRTDKVPVEPEISSELRQCLHRSFELSRSLHEEELSTRTILVGMLERDELLLSLLKRCGVDTDELRMRLLGVVELPLSKKLSLIEKAGGLSRSPYYSDNLHYKDGHVCLEGFSDEISLLLSQSLERAQLRGAESVGILDVLPVVVEKLEFPYKRLAEKLQLDRVEAEVIETAESEVEAGVTKKASRLSFLGDFDGDLRSAIARARAIAGEIDQAVVDLPLFFFVILTGDYKSLRSLLKDRVDLKVLVQALENSIKGQRATGCMPMILLTAEDMLSLPLSEAAMKVARSAVKASTEFRLNRTVCTEDLLLSLTLVEPELPKNNLSWQQIAKHTNLLNRNEPFNPDSLDVAEKLSQFKLSANTALVLQEACRVALLEDDDKIYPAHILLALTRVPESGYHKILQGLEVSPLKVRVILEKLFDRDSLRWKPALSKSENNDRSKKEKWSTHKQTGRPVDFPNNCAHYFQQQLNECLKQGMKSEMHSVGLVGLVQYILASDAFLFNDLLLSQFPTTAKSKAASIEITQSINIDFTEQVHMLLRKASNLSRSRNVQLSAWSFMVVVSGEYPSIVRDLIPTLVSFNSPTLVATFERIWQAAIISERQLTDVSDKPFELLSFSDDARKVWQEANELTASHGKEDFIDAYLLLGAVQFLQRQNPTLLEATGLKLDDVDRMLRKSRRPKPGSAEAAVPVLPAMLAFFAEAMAAISASQYVQVEHLLLALAHIPKCSAAIVLGNLMIDRTRLRDAILKSQAADSKRQPACIDTKRDDLYKLETALKTAKEFAVATKCGEIYCGHLLVGLVFADEKLAGCFEKCLGFNRDLLWQNIGQILYPSAKGPFHERIVPSSKEVDELLRSLHDKYSEARPFALVDVVYCMLDAGRQCDAAEFFKSLQIDPEDLRIKIGEYYKNTI